MVRIPHRAGSWGMLLISLATLQGCKGPEQRILSDGPPQGVATTNLDYVDSDAFDLLFESALVHHDPVIMIRTGHATFDWEGRLNAWIAAWNRGGEVVAPKSVRGQIPLPAEVNADSLRELRLLADTLLDRIEVTARAGASWWHEERLRQRRVALLKPYDLRFHVNETNTIDIVLFNGAYAPDYPAFVHSLTGPEIEEQPVWRRGLTCSRCRDNGKKVTLMGREVEK